MSRKKTVQQEYLQGDIPAPSANQKIAMSLGTRGGNTVEVQFEDGSTTLCLIPSKFNKKLWIRKGGLVIVEETVLEETTLKVTGTVLHVLYDEQLKSLKKQGVLIPDFGVQSTAPESSAPDRVDEYNSDSDGSLPEIHVNTNRVSVPQYSDVDSD